MAQILKEEREENIKYTEALNKRWFAENRLNAQLQKQKNLEMAQYWEDYTEAMSKAHRAQMAINNTVEETNTYWSSFKEGFKDAMDVDIFEKFEEIGKQTFNNLTKMLTDFVTTGKMNFQDFARTVTRMIVEALIGQAVQYAINKSVEMFKASALREAMISVYKGALKTFASIPWPWNMVAVGGAIASGMALVKTMQGFEKGGRPPVNQPSIVGEAGPELFVPNSAGTIIPNNQLGGGKPVTVNFNINTVDARGFNELLVNSRGVIVNMINNAVNEKGRQAII
jgi:phage-related minor tail protein